MLNFHIHFIRHYAKQKKSRSSFFNGSYLYLNTIKTEVNFLSHHLDVPRQSML